MSGLTLGNDVVRPGGLARPGSPRQSVIVPKGAERTVKGAASGVPGISMMNPTPPAPGGDTAKLNTFPVSVWGSPSAGSRAAVRVVVPSCVFAGHVLL